MNVNKIELIDGLYMCTSFRKHDSCEDMLKATVSFLVESEDGEVIVELCITQGGPITRIEKCSKDYENAQTHWMLGYCKGYDNWAQTAVCENDLPESILNNNFEHVRDVLKRYL